jgi:hypothetical protein
MHRHSSVHSCIQKHTCMASIHPSIHPSIHSFIHTKEACISIHPFSQACMRMPSVNHSLHAQTHTSIRSAKRTHAHAIKGDVHMPSSSRMRAHNRGHSTIEADSFRDSIESERGPMCTFDRFHLGLATLAGDGVGGSGSSGPRGRIWSKERGDDDRATGYHISKRHSNTCTYACMYAGSTCM